MGTGPHEDRRVANRVARIEMVGEPGHVAHEQRPWSRPGHRPDVVGKVLDTDMEGVLPAEHHLGERIPDEDDVDSGLVYNAGKGRVVGGDHDNGFRPLAALASPDVGHRHLSCHFRTSSRPAHLGCRRSISGRWFPG